MAEQMSGNRQKKAHFTFIWAIEDSSPLFLPSCEESPTFIANSIGSTEWRLIVLKKVDSDSMYLGIRKVKNDRPESIEIEFDLSVLTADGSPVGMETLKKQFEGTETYWHTLFENSAEIYNRRKAEFLPNDTLTVRCRMWKPGTEIPEPKTCSARSSMSVDRLSFIWTIREFDILQPKQKTPYIVKPNKEGFPQLSLNLSLRKKKGKMYIGIQINKNSAKSNYYMLSKFAVLDSIGRVAHSRDAYHAIKMKNRNVLKLRKFIQTDKLTNDESLVQNGVLTLKCEFLIEAKSYWTRIENENLDLKHMKHARAELLDMQLGEPDESCTAQCLFKKAFEDLYGDVSLSDIRMQVGTASFPAHKTVLGARSPVFKAMLTQSKKEERKEIAEIADIKPETMNRLLLYIYKDTVEELQCESAMDLYRAAANYQLEGLRKKCAFFLKSNFSVTNVSSILLLADIHKDEDLRKAAEYFLSEHKNEIFN